MRFLKIVVIMLVFLFAIIVSTGSAAPILQAEANVTTIAVIITVIALLLAFFFLMGGVKYVTPENVLDTEIRKNLYEYQVTLPGISENSNKPT
jgi:amino acid transporter